MWTQTKTSRKHAPSLTSQSKKKLIAKTSPSKQKSKKHQLLSQLSQTGTSFHWVLGVCSPGCFLQRGASHRWPVTTFHHQIGWFSEPSTGGAALGAGGAAGAFKRVDSVKMCKDDSKMCKRSSKSLILVIHSKQFETIGNYVKPTQPRRVSRSYFRPLDLAAGRKLKNITKQQAAAKKTNRSSREIHTPGFTFSWTRPQNCLKSKFFRLKIFKNAQRPSSLLAVTVAGNLSGTGDIATNVRNNSCFLVPFWGTFTAKHGTKVKGGKGNKRGTALLVFRCVQLV